MLSRESKNGLMLRVNIYCVKAKSLPLKAESLAFALKVKSLLTSLVSEDFSWKNASEFNGCWPTLVL